MWVEAAVTVELVSPDQTNPLDPGVPLPGGVADPAQDAGMADIVTGAADADNGALEECGLGHEYMNIAILNRELSFQTSMDSAAPVPGSSSATGAPRTTDRPAGRRPYATTR